MLLLTLVSAVFARSAPLPSCAYTEAGCYGDIALPIVEESGQGSSYQDCESLCFGRLRSCEDYSLGEMYACMDDVNAECAYERDHGAGDICRDDWSVYDECWTAQADADAECDAAYDSCEMACR
jgi:hypothetical protein